MSCFLATHGHMEDGSETRPCEGPLIRAHLIPQQLLKREFPRGAEVAGQWHTLEELIDHPATWVPACGGLTGIGGHHGAFDYSKRLRLLRFDVPSTTEGFAAELGIDWWLDREYGMVVRG